MVATARPQGEQSRLCIQVDSGGGKLDWPEIAALAERDDLPTII